MDNNTDNKKIIQMVAVIGILCIFIGIATRIRHNSQRTLADYQPTAQTNVSESDAGSTSSTSASTSDTTYDSNGNSVSNIDSVDNELSSSDSVDNSNSANGSASTNESGSSNGSVSSNSTNILSEMTPAEYDAFYYTDNDDATSLVHLLYYNTDQEVTSGILECNSDEAYDLLLIFYKLYKNHYEFTSILPLSDFENEEAARAANNTYCKDGIISINPLYNPFIAYEGSAIILTPENAADYLDRNASFPYKITDEDYAYTLFTEAGYYWGGHCNGYKDYSSFRK